MGLNIDEQEITISASRDEDYATIYCSDNTWITKMDKLVDKSPNLFKLIEQNDISKTYRFPKRLISIRSSIREMTDEQRQAAAVRMQNYHSKRNAM